MTAHELRLVLRGKRAFVQTDMGGLVRVSQGKAEGFRRQHNGHLRAVVEGRDVRLSRADVAPDAPPEKPSRPPQSSVEKQDALVADYANGASLGELATRYGYRTVEGVRQVLVRRGIPRRPRGHGNKGKEMSR
ncbi:MAG: hypothetical protein OXE76_04075 [Alphaproteobacteria bacterium]|nr:hypothetical protein [Alphaproteobacteria bacterium]